MLKRFILLFTLFISITNASLASDVPKIGVIKGKVLSGDDNLPLPFATIFIKGANSHHLTDINGEFSLKAKAGDIIIVTSLGFEAKETALKEAYMQVELKPSVYQLESVEIVATALGIKRSARELGAAAEVVGTEKLNQGAPVNPLTGLTSKVAGLRVNMYDSKVDPQIQITLRGYRSITGDNSPLYIVDGVPMPDINRLNPNDIESITVLKGANAAALYGSEGVNGALIISTKSGTKGKGTISYKNTTKFSKVFLLPEAQTQFGQGNNGVYSANQYQSWGPRFDGTMKDFGAVLPNGVQPQVLYAAPSDDVRLDLFNTGLNMQHDLSFAKEDEKSSYYLSLQNVTVKGIIPGDKSTRNGIRFNSTQHFGDLRVGVNLNYVYTKNVTAPDGPWVAMYSLPANFPIAEMKNWRDDNSWGNPNNYFFSTTGGSSMNSPYYYIDTHRNQTEQQLVNGKLELEYPITSWAKVMYRLGLYSSSTQTHNTVEKFDSYVAGRSQSGTVSDGSSNLRRLNGDLIVTLHKNFGRFSTNAVFGQNFRDDYTKATTLSSSNLLFSDIFNPGSREGNLGGSATITKYRQLALYGEVTGGYNNYLFLTLTGRNDWVSVLSKDNRSYFYPGVSTSFVFTDAIEGLKDSPVLSFGKIYASYNKTGNVNLNPYSLNLAYSQSGGFPFGNTVSFIPASKNPNRNIKPEFVHSYEVGTQLSFLDRRLNTEISYVYTSSKGQIFDATTSAATGYTNTIVNLGELTNNILEVSINGDIIRTRDVRWNVGFNYAYIKNEVKDLYGSGEAEEYNKFRQSYAIKGKPYPSLKVLDYERDPQGRIIVDATTGLPKAATEPTYLGTMVPPHQMGLQTSLTYKDFTVYMDFDCRLGGWTYSEVANNMIKYGTHPMTVAYNREEFVIPNSVIASTDANGNKVYTPNTGVVAQNSDKSSYWNNYVAGYHINFAAKSDFLKMRTLSVQYNLPRSLLQKQSVLSKVSLSLEATNLFILRHHDNDFGDPEYLYNNTDGYFSWRQVPPYRTYGFSVNLVF